MMNLPAPTIASNEPKLQAWTLPPIDEFNKELESFKQLGE